MTLFRLYLLALLIILSGYTLVVIGDYGMNLFAVSGRGGAGHGARPAGAGYVMRRESMGRRSEGSD